MLLTELSCHQLCNVHRDLIRNSQAIATNCKTVHRHRSRLLSTQSLAFLAQQAKKPRRHMKGGQHVYPTSPPASCPTSLPLPTHNTHGSVSVSVKVQPCRRYKNTQLKQKCSQQTHSLKSYNWKRRTCPVAKTTARSSCTSHVTPLNPKAGC